MMVTEEPALAEQLAYYGARAAEYDQWWLRQGRYDRGESENAGWFREVAALDATMEEFNPYGDVLELACGTAALDPNLPAENSIIHNWRLNDGREFQVYKIFYNPAELQSRLNGLGWVCSIGETNTYFFYGHGKDASA